MRQSGSRQSIRPSQSLSRPSPQAISNTNGNSAVQPGGRQDGSPPQSGSLQSVAPSQSSSSPPEQNSRAGTQPGGASQAGQSGSAQSTSPSQSSSRPSGPHDSNSLQPDPSQP